MNGFHVNTQLGRTTASLRRALISNGWAVGSPIPHETLLPTGTDEVPRVYLYSEGESTTYVILPDKITPPENYSPDDYIIRTLENHGHSAKSSTANDFKNLLTSARINNPNITNSLDEADKSARILRNYKCIMMALARKEQ